MDFGDATSGIGHLGATFHLTARAIELLVEFAGLVLVGWQRGDDEARIGAAFQCRQVDVAGHDGFLVLLASRLCRALTLGSGGDPPCARSKRGSGRRFSVWPPCMGLEHNENMVTMRLSFSIL